MMRLALAAVLLTCSASVEKASAQETPGREFVTFVWTSGIDGRAGIGGRVGDVDASFDDLIDFVDVGSSVRYRSTSETLGWFIEGTYIQLSDTLEAVPEISRIEFTRRVGELGV